MASPFTWSLVIALPKKGNLQLCQKHHTISLISHPSKAMLKVLMNRLKLQAEELIKKRTGRFQSRKEHDRAHFQP